MPAFNPVPDQNWDRDTDSDSQSDASNAQSLRRSLSEVRNAFAALRKELSDWQESYREQMRPTMTIIPPDRDTQLTTTTYMPINHTSTATTRTVATADNDDDRLEFLKQRLARQLSSDLTSGA